MKKICFVVPRAYSFFNPEIRKFNDMVGGSQKQAYLLSSELAKDEEFDVNFCVADFGQADAEILQNVKLWKSFNFDDGRFQSFLKLYKTIRKIDAEVYIFRAADLGVAFFSLIIRFLLRKKIVYMLGADVELSFNDNKKQFGFLTAFFMKFTYRYANKITVQSKQQFNTYFKNYRRRPDAIVKNIIEMPEYVGIENKKDILWVGRLDEIKNPEIFIKLAEKYPEEKFVMIAPIVSESLNFGSNIHKMARNCNNLELIEFVKPNEILPFYKKAKMYVMTSESEGFSNTMLEAMACGCPVLSYKVNNDQILTNHHFGLCAGGNLDKFYTDFEIIIRDKNLLETMGENAKIYLLLNHKKQEILDNFRLVLK